jgi:tRNA A-37 threonylcarbamoyl transferase component Bud32
VVFPPGELTGTLTVHPAFAGLFARLGLNSAAAFLELPGEVVSGHPDRHVVRVELPGAARAFYLKRQHVVGWRERLRNRLAGFGWSSRCEREAEALEQLDSRGLPVPRWAAFGILGSRAFLLVEEVPCAVDLRRILSDNTLSFGERRTLAARIGEAVAAVHAAGFDTPDLTAKHVLVNPATLAVTFLDWQSAVRNANVATSSRANALAALHASLTAELATPAERLRVLRAYRESGRATFTPPANFTARILRAAGRHAQRRSVRDQLQPEASAQRLVWLAGEAVCAVPEVAAVWPRPAVAPPFYGAGPEGVSRIHFAGRDAILVRGRASAPLGRLRAWLHATPWRSPGVTLGRVLFHLERYGIPAPRLLAFGQRLVSTTGAEWFVLHEVPPGVPMKVWLRTASFTERRAILGELTALLRKLHDAGCRVTGDPLAAPAVHDGRVLVADPWVVRIVRRVSESARRRELRRAARLLGVE